MNPEKLVGIVTDAVVDAVKLRLPTLIADAVRTDAGIAAALKAVAEVRAEVRDNLAAHAHAADELLAKADELTAARDSAAEPLRVLVSDALRALPAPTPGERGEPGPPGPPGAPGRDASVMPTTHYKPGERYAAGSWVQHRAGVWYAQCDTSTAPGDALSGWQLFLDGAEPHAAEVDPDGFLSVVYHFASGVEKRLTTGYHAPRYAGVYDPGATYHANDFVTADGSLWAARATVSGARPATDDGARYWVLAVKRGRDGRDGAPGQPGPRGEPGPPGESAPKRSAKPKPNGVST